MSEIKEKSAVDSGIPATEIENKSTDIISDDTQKIKGAHVISIYDLSLTEQNLARIAEECKDKIEIAKAMACTEDTKKAVKKTRAELKKQFNEYEAERKERTAEYEEPLKKFKELYNKYIKEPFVEADTALGQKIDEVERMQKAKKYDDLKAYALELRTAYSLNWLDVDRIMPNITISKSQTAYEKEIAEILDRIKRDVDTINQLGDDGETLAEYMDCLDFTQACMTIKQRKQAIEQAKQASQAYTQAETEKQAVEENVTQLAPPIIEEEPQKPEEPVYTMTFTVSGTMEQLKALKAFMVESKIDFKNGGKKDE